MSKKKASGGSTTMTLKDFHGGSIPSDLPLPSAPGVMVRPSDRPAFDRQGSWGNPIGRSDHRLRPGSAGAVRNFDDKTPFLSPSSHIGRNFDEDERKPLDGVSGPRRMVSDESTHALPERMELKPDYSSTGRLPSRPISSPASQMSSNSVSSYAGRVAEATRVGGNSQNFGVNSSYSGRFAEVANVGVMNSQNLDGNRGQASSATNPNAWEIRKEEVSAVEPLPATRSDSNAAFKLAHASALEKVASGRWQSKQQNHHQTDVEVIKHAAIDSEYCSKGDTFNNKSSYNPVDVMGSAVYHEAVLVRHAERSLTVDDGIRGGGREFPTYERSRSPMLPGTIESNPQRFVQGVQQVRNDSRFGEPQLQSPLTSEQSERPKLKLLPRSKPLETLEPSVDYKQVYQPHNSDRLVIVTESYGNTNSIKYGLSGSDSENRAVERPKLNLKPRSQPLEQLEGNIRKSVFGGARPREFVLKERGIDDVAVNNDGVVQLHPPNRVKQDVLRTETVPAHATPSRYNEKPENQHNPRENRIRKNNDKRDNRADAERTDMQRRNWRSENWKNNREPEKQLQQQQPKDRPPSPDTWRKQSEPPKPASPDGPGVRYGKAASAVELAQAFSRPVSDPKVVTLFPGQRAVPAQGQMPFSRLMDQTSRAQINGY